MNLFYRNISFTLLIGVGFFLFLKYADTISQYPIFSHPLVAKTIGDIANFVLIFAAAVIFIDWFIEARKKAQKERISFLNALFALFVEMGGSRAKRREELYKSMPEPLKQPLPNGLFWLLFVIIVGFGSIFFFVWQSQGHL